MDLSPQTKNELKAAAKRLKDEITHLQEEVAQRRLGILKLERELEALYRIIPGLEESIDPASAGVTRRRRRTRQVAHTGAADETASVRLEHSSSGTQLVEESPSVYIAHRINSSGVKPGAKGQEKEPLQLEIEGSFRDNVRAILKFTGIPMKPNDVKSYLQHHGIDNPGKTDYSTRIGNELYRMAKGQKSNIRKVPEGYIWEEDEPS